METSDTLARLRNYARLQFGDERAAQLDPALIDVASDLDTLAEFDLNPDDMP